jgi:UDP-N-acetylmuramoylalanine--D-glutamate ligase
MKKPFYLVAGLGQTGYSVAQYLHRQRLPFAVFDTRREVEKLTEFSAQCPNIEIYLGDFPTSLYSKISQIIASPGLSLEEPFLVQAKRHGIPIIGDIECFAREIKAPVIAITGTNGKSTVTTLVGEMARAAGKKVAVAGNIGLPILDLLDEHAQDYDLWVLELSSFQLDLIESLQPTASCILNISPDHLDRHHDLEHYIQAKQRIYQHTQTLVYNREDAATFPKSSTSGKHITFGLNAPSTPTEWGLIQHNHEYYLAQGSTPFMPVDVLKIYGRHNWQNALAACALAASAGIPTEAIRQALQAFPGLEHRCQTVRIINDVQWINDSKGTNVGACVSAIEGIGPTLKGKIILIAGGLGKGADFSSLKPKVETYVREVILIGKDAPLIEQALEHCVPLYHAKSLADAIDHAQAQAQAGDAVLLSPACASMDMFKNYEHRGQCFKELVLQLNPSS